MLIDARSSSEVRIAIVNDAKLETYQVEVAESGLTRGNIYRGVIANLEPSLNAAFVDYGADRNGFLAGPDVVPEARYLTPPKGGRPKIGEILEPGRPIVVQVTRDPIGQKGAALTTNLSLAGRNIVLTPFDDMLGVSRKVDDDDDRKKLKALVSRLEMPKGCGAIVRTNAREQNITTLRRDLSALKRLWKNIQSQARQGEGARLLYSDQDLILRALRDLLDNTIEEVLVDSPQALEKAQDYIHDFMPRSKTKLSLYEEPFPIFTNYGVEKQIDSIYSRKVELPSGGSIVIDPTEALTAIDVNSGRSKTGKTQEETAVATNVEAAEEVGRQLQLRDIGGLLVVDLIDMRSRKYQQQVIKALKDAMKTDRARYQVGRLSANGLLEINRQRIQQSLGVRTHHSCPTCAGSGLLPKMELVSLNLMRKIASRASAGQLEKVRVELHPEVADGVQNLRRKEIVEMEDLYGIEIEFSSSWRMERNEEDLHWVFAKDGRKARTPSRRLPKAVPVPPKKPIDAPVSLTLEAKGPGDEEQPTRSRRGRGNRRRRRPRSGEKSGAKTAAKPQVQGDRRESSQEVKPKQSRSRKGRRSRRPQEGGEQRSESGRSNSRRFRGRSKDVSGNRPEGNRAQSDRKNSVDGNRARPKKKTAREVDGNSWDYEPKSRPAPRRQSKSSNGQPPATRRRRPFTGSPNAPRRPSGAKPPLKTDTD